MNPPQDNCPNCGANLADGLCPQCLLLAGMEPTPTSSRSRWVPPTPEELQAQLTRYVLGFDRGQTLAPGAIQAFLDGTRAGEQKRG